MDIANNGLVTTGKQITLKRSRPNPVFLDWLEELLVEAKQKKCKLEHQLTEALTSLSKYPLPLNTGAECRILKGFDSRLCNFIEQRLKAQNTLGMCHMAHQDNDKPIHVLKSNVAPTKMRSKKYIAQLLRYSSTLIALKQLQVNSKDTVTRQKVLNYALEELQAMITKLLVHKLSLAAFPRSFRPIKEYIRIDPLTENYFLTKRGLSEATYLHSIVKDHKVINSSTQTEILDSDICDLTEDVTTIELEDDCFDIILLIDKNETSGLSNKKDPTVAEFKKFLDLKHEYRSLKVGDFTWIARHKDNANLELVLPYIVERKRLDDLSASIKDGRFHEQKFRLRKCGLENVIYMVESYSSKKYMGLPVQTLMQALANTRIQDGFKVQMTDSLSHSVRFLAMMTKRLNFEYRGKTLKGRNAEPDDNMLMTYDFFNKMSIKNKPLTVKETFIKLLLQLKGLSVEKALAITSVYKTPKSLIQAYESLDRENGEMLLATLKYGELNRNVGPVVSKSIYQLFSSFNLH